MLYLHRRLDYVIMSSMLAVASFGCEERVNVGVGPGDPCVHGECPWPLVCVDDTCILLADDTSTDLALDTNVDEIAADTPPDTDDPESEPVWDVSDPTDDTTEMDTAVDHPADTLLDDSVPVDTHLCDPSEPCCDAAGNYLPTDTVCDPDLDSERECRDGPDGPVYERIRQRFCDGYSGGCSGTRVWTDWTPVETCGSDEICEDGECVEDVPPDCDITLESPTNGGTMTLSSYTFTWDQPCSGSVDVYICPAPDVTACSSDWICLAASMSGSIATYSGGGGDGSRTSFFCRSGGLSAGSTYYWTVDSPWALPSFWSFTAS